LSLDYRYWHSNEHSDYATEVKYSDVCCSGKWKRSISGTLSVSSQLSSMFCT